jgi:hypothetical protein
MTEKLYGKPMPSDNFFSHAPHFVLWMVVTACVTGCGFLIADVLELRSANRGLVLSIACVVGMLVATLIVRGAGAHV